WPGNFGYVGRYCGVYSERYKLMLYYLLKLPLLFSANCSTLLNDGNDCDPGLPKVDAGPGQIKDVLQIVFAVIAVLSVLMITIAGLRFITGQANPQEIKKARDTIVYALAGLVVSLAAAAIVHFALGKVQ